MIFNAIFLTFAVLAVAAYFHASKKKKRIAGESWEELLSQLQPVHMEGIARVALDYLQPSKGQLAIQTDTLWDLVGREEGLRRMQANAEVLIQLAGIAQQWNFQEATIVAERMRRDGLVLRRSVKELSQSIALGYAKALGPFCVQEAASAYYLMTQRLLALYETSHAGRHPRLAAAL